MDWQVPRLWLLAQALLWFGVASAQDAAPAPLYDLRLTDEQVEYVLWSPDSSRFMTLGDGLNVFDAATGARILARPGIVPSQARWSADSRIIISGSSVFNLETGEEAYWLGAFDPALSPDGERLLTTDPHTTSSEPRIAVQKVRVQTEEIRENLFSIPGETGEWSADGAHILTYDSSYDSETMRYLGGFVARFDAADGAQERLLRWDTLIGEIRVEGYGAEPQRLSHAGVMTVLASPDDSRLLSASADRYKLWQMPDGALIADIERRSGSADPGCGFIHFVRENAWSPDSGAVFLWSDNTYQVWDAAQGEQRFALPQKIHLSWSADSARLLAAGASAGVFDAQTGEQILALDAPDIGQVFWNARETRIIGWGGVGIAYVWDAHDGRLLFTARHYAEPSACGLPFVPPAVSPDGTRLVTWLEGSSAWDVELGNHVETRRNEALYSTDLRQLFAAPALDAESLRRLAGGVSLEVIDGPVIADHLVWWRLRARDGSEGWTPEKVGADLILENPAGDFSASLQVWSLENQTDND
jgi:WD40 repeat protein